MFGLTPVKWQSPGKIATSYMTLLPWSTLALSSRSLATDRQRMCSKMYVSRVHGSNRHLVKIPGGRSVKLIIQMTFNRWIKIFARSKHINGNKLNAQLSQHSAANRSFSNCLLPLCQNFVPNHSWGGHGRGAGEGLNTATPQKINEHRITARKVNETPSPQVRNTYF